jgi:hypothetical protein
MVLKLIAKVAGANSGSAGPYVIEAGRESPVATAVRSLVPMAQRDPRRLRIVEEVKTSLLARDALPQDRIEEDRVIASRSMENSNGRDDGEFT